MTITMINRHDYQEQLLIGRVSIINPDC